MSTPRSTPVKVSPVIRGARYSLLLCGIIYGINKKAIYEMYEKKEKPRRELQYKEKKERISKKSLNDFREFLGVFAEAFGVEVPSEF